MRPTLFTIGSLPIRSYEVMVAIGFLIALYIAVQRAKKKNIPFRFMLDLGLYILISGFVGARIFYILQHIRSYDSLADRIFFGFVTDFIRVRLWFIHSFWWPNFNIADSGVTVGAIMLIIVLFRDSYKERLES